MRRSRALVVVVALCALAACEDEPTPEIPDPPSPTVASPTESETSPTTSPSPEALTPEETVRAWVKAQNVALRTGETEPLRSFAADECEGCSDYPDGIDEVYDAGGSFQGGQWTLVRANAALADEAFVRLNVAVRIAGGSTVTEAGADPTVYEPDSRLMTFEMVLVDQTWRISLIAFIS